MHKQQQQLQQRHPWSTVVEHTNRHDRGDVRRCWNPVVHPELGVHGCRTLYEGFRRGCRLNPLGPCLGYRAVSTTGFATPFVYSSYSECLARVDAVAAGFDALGLLRPDVDDGKDGLKVIGLYSRNCVEWVIAEHAAYAVGGVTAPLYDTLGPDAVQFVLAQTGAKSAVAAREGLEALCRAKRSGQCPAFTHVILIDGVTAEASDRARASGLELVSFARVEAVGAESIATSGRHKHSPPSPDDVATFCYTSGTTGNPKGALITHQNLVSTVAGIIQSIGDFEPHVYDRHLSFLPLAHIMERIGMTSMLMSGASVAFYRGDPMLLVEDLQACRPTILPVAPRVLNKIYDKIMLGISSQGGMKKKMFDTALAAKTEGLLRRGIMKHPVYDRLIFNKIKRGLGMDHVRFMLSGSAPLSENVMMFFRCLLGAPVVEGYGQTEGSAGCCISHPADVATAGHVGGPVGGVDVVLVDVPEMGYRHTDTLHRGRQPCLGRGEICLRGPNVFRGYYKDEQATAAAVDSEGWLHSGDIGLWRPDGSLQIIDRKKNIFKLAQGEYVAPEKIENILLRSPLIAQCFVYGDSLQSSLVAIVVPDEEPARRWAEISAPLIVGAPFADLCSSSSLRQAVVDDIARLSREDGLHGFETVRAVHLTHRAFTAEEDMLTPTFKLKRQKVRDAYQREIRDLYSAMPPTPSKL